MNLLKPHSRVFIILVLFFLLSCNTSGPITKNSPTREQTEQQTVDNPTPSRSTNTSNTSSVEFDLSTDNDIPPSDILEEISFYGQGGRDCYDPSYPEVKIDFPPTDEELMIQSTMISCGWQGAEIVTGTILYPDGRSFSQTIALEQDLMEHTYAAKLRFAPTLEDPVGTYTFILEGTSGKVSDQAKFRMPTGSRIFNFNENQILLYGFSPLELVNLYCYNNSNGAFWGWQNYQVDSSGQLLVSVPRSKCFFAAIGEETGEVHLLEYLAHGGTYDWALEGIKKQSTNNELTSCSGAPTQRLDVGNMAYVCTSADSVKLREGPGKDHPVIKSLVPGADIEIIGGPECNDNWSWWQVETESGFTGWMSEGGDNTDKYFLCPRN